MAEGMPPWALAQVDGDVAVKRGEVRRLAARYREAIADGADSTTAILTMVLEFTGGDEADLRAADPQLLIVAVVAAVAISELAEGDA